MDIYNFINSKDIKKYLKDQNYQFSSLETAWLIYQSEAYGFNDKKKAWLELIDTMPDCEMPKRNQWDIEGNLHENLLKYINAIEQIEKRFIINEDGAIYSYSYLYNDDSEWTEDHESLFDSFENCKNDYLKDIRELDEYYNTENSKVVKYRIIKRLINNKDFKIEIEFTKTNQINCINQFYGIENQDEINNILNLFIGFWFDIPTPFKKGDIVWFPEPRQFIKYNEDGPFVLRTIASWEETEYPRLNGDETDMYIQGYFVNPNGTIYSEVRPNYMDLEYFNEEFEECEKVLIPLSKFIKGEIGIDLLLLAYRELILKIESDDAMIYSWFSYEPLLDELGIR